MSAGAIGRRLMYRALIQVPGGAVGRARTAGKLAPLLEAAQAAAGAALYGHDFPVAHGPAAGLTIVAERRSLAWLSGRVEREVQAALVQHLRPGATFVDVGASIGFFTLLAARLVGPNGFVVAFEPQAAAVSSIRRNSLLNGFSTVKIVGAAVSAKAGQAGLRSVGKATAHLVPAARDAARVDVTTLDDHFVQRPRGSVVVKIDVEGHEREVLAGMTRLLGESSPVLIVETHGTADGIRADLAGHGYATSSLGRSHVLSVPSR
jgi:FkbM family methyltransferase